MNGARPSKGDVFITYDMIDTEQVHDIVFDGIDFTDHPDYSDAHIIEATYMGREMTDTEIEDLQDQQPMWVYENLMDNIF